MFLENRVGVIDGCACPDSFGDDVVDVLLDESLEGVLDCCFIVVVLQVHFFAVEFLKEIGLFYELLEPDLEVVEVVVHFVVEVVVEDVADLIFDFEVGVIVVDLLKIDQYFLQNIRLFLETVHGGDVDGVALGPS